MNKSLLFIIDWNKDFNAKYLSNIFILKNKSFTSKLKL